MGEKLVEEGRIDVCYNPLNYAWNVHEEYLRRMGGLGAKNGGSWNESGTSWMGQMGIPFAATSVVRDLLGISGIPVNQPNTPDERRPVIGLEYHKEEVSGTRLWGLLNDHMAMLTRLHPEFSLVNHCPPDVILGTSCYQYHARQDWRRY